MLTMLCLQLIFFSEVLQESLGGNAKTSLIITCSPSYFNEQDRWASDVYTETFLVGTWHRRPSALFVLARESSGRRLGWKLKEWMYNSVVLHIWRNSELKKWDQDQISRFWHIFRGQNDQERGQSQPWAIRWGQNDFVQMHADAFCLAVSQETFASFVGNGRGVSNLTWWHLSVTL